MLVTIVGLNLCTWLFRIASAGNSRIFNKPGEHWPLLVRQGICGKLIVATSEAQLPELKALEMKAPTNGDWGAKGSTGVAKEKLTTYYCLLPISFMKSIS